MRIEQKGIGGRVSDFIVARGVDLFVRQRTRQPQVLESPINHETVEIQPLRSAVIILDGNRRWAKEHGLPPEAGYPAGEKTALMLAEELFKNPYLETVYPWAFAKKNWGRPKVERDAIMESIKDGIIKGRPIFHKYGVLVKWIGEESRVKSGYPEAYEAVKETERQTSHYSNKRLGLLIDYDGTEQNLRIAQQIVEMGRQDPNLVVTQELFDSLRCGWAEGFRPAQAVVRTSGENRTSGLLDIVGEAEFISLEHNLPDATISDADYVFKEFSERQIRNGL